MFTPLSHWCCHRPHIVMTGLLALVGLAAGQLAWPNLTAWSWIWVGSFFGPFISYVLFYRDCAILTCRKARLSGQPAAFCGGLQPGLFGEFITAPQFCRRAADGSGVGLMLWQTSEEK